MFAAVCGLSIEAHSQPASWGGQALARAGMARAAGNTQHVVRTAMSPVPTVHT